MTAFHTAAFRCSSANICVLQPFVSPLLEGGGSKGEHGSRREGKPYTQPGGKLSGEASWLLLRVVISNLFFAFFASSGSCAVPGSGLADSRGVRRFLLMFQIEEQAYPHPSKGLTLDMHGKDPAI